MKQILHDIFNTSHNHSLPSNVIINVRVMKAQNRSNSKLAERYNQRQINVTKRKCEIDLKTTPFILDATRHQNKRPCDRPDLSVHSYLLLIRNMCVYCRTEHCTGNMDLCVDYLATHFHCVMERKLAFSKAHISLSVAVVSDLSRERERSLNLIVHKL